ncbi:MAG: hypothetical protein M1820_007385 [Bogoriella megaspora]|nr:MAG: hypothetical protein M1820_007385 [Bogoriella megaspora]
MDDLAFGILSGRASMENRRSSEEIMLCCMSSLRFLRIVVCNSASVWFLGREYPDSEVLDRVQAFLEAVPKECILSWGLAEGDGFRIDCISGRVFDDAVQKLRGSSETKHFDTQGEASSPQSKEPKK